MVEQCVADFDHRFLPISVTSCTNEDQEGFVVAASIYLIARHGSHVLDVLQHDGTFEVQPGFEAAGMEVEQHILCFMLITALWREKCAGLLKAEKLKAGDVPGLEGAFYLKHQSLSNLWWAVVWQAFEDKFRPCSPGECSSNFALKMSQISWFVASFCFRHAAYVHPQRNVTRPMSQIACIWWTVNLN